jgi:hypothetical protein
MRSAGIEACLFRISRGLSQWTIADGRDIMSVGQNLAQRVVEGGHQVRSG